MIDIKLYLGAHKTATTHLQGILLANRERLAVRGVALSAPQDVRKQWLPEFFRFCSNPSRAGEIELKRKLTALAPEQGAWILTEENIVGVSNDLGAKSGIYPQAAERVRCLLELFPDANVTLFFSLRSYDGFYRSAYSEVVRNRGFIHFDHFYDEARFRDNSWVTLVRGFHNVLPQDKIVLWKFEDFGSLVSQLIQLLTGQQDVSTFLNAYKPEVTRPSLSQKTMDILALLQPVLNRKESLALVERINRVYSTAASHPPFQPFDAVQQDVFLARYLDDVAAIRRDFPAIRFLAP